MAAQFKEIIVQAYPIHFQNLGPQLCKYLFDGVSGSQKSLLAFAAASFWSRQRLGVNFSIRR